VRALGVLAEVVVAQKLLDNCFGTIIGSDWFNSLIIRPHMTNRLRFKYIRLTQDEWLQERKLLEASARKVGHSEVTHLHFRHEGELDMFSAK